MTSMKPPPDWRTRQDRNIKPAPRSMTDALIAMCGEIDRMKIAHRRLELAGKFEALAKSKKQE